MEVYFILVRPQLGENIGMSARAIKNFGHKSLRIVSPRDGWPNQSAQSSSVGAIDVIEKAEIYDDISSAVADLNFIYATSARSRDMNINVISSLDFFDHTKENCYEKIGIMFGPENSGLTNEDISYANCLLNIPINKEMPSINLAASIAILAYELNKSSLTSFQASSQSNLATKNDLDKFFNFVFKKLDEVGFYKVDEKKYSMNNNIRAIFNRIPNLTCQEISTISGIFTSFMHKK